ncbi:hypothetical protein [Ornithinimicrobium kibberense]|uniref:hypothetical protein n=1 Tax=Ornithinimicrobium kibberense TaxID=282060 RepID=UPI00360638BA
MPKEGVPLLRRCPGLVGGQQPAFVGQPSLGVEGAVERIRRGVPGQVGSDVARLPPARGQATHIAEASSARSASSSCHDSPPRATYVQHLRATVTASAVL